MNNILIGFNKLFFLILTTLFILTGCKQEQNHSNLHIFSENNMMNNQKKTPPTSFYNENSLPILIPEGELSMVNGWLNNDEILYMTSSQDGSILHLYNLKNGQNKILYKSINPIISTIISPNRESILIHSAPSTYEGLLTIINNDGEELFSKGFPSVEMTFDWDQYHSNQLLVTAFKEDWSFSNYLLNVNKKEMEQIDIRKPFAKWVDENKLAFLDWNENNISLFSPLIEKEISKGEELLLKEEIFQFETYINKILTITINKEEQLAFYTFYSKNMEVQTSFQAPILSNYSGWLIPNFELSSDQKDFLTMLPFESREADTYREGFEFISYQLDSGKKEIILEKTENVPFTCSPNKENCLIGYQFEKLLNLKKKTITPLF